MSFEVFSEITVSFIIANIASEVIKYLTAKLAKKVDSLVNSPLD